MQNTDTISSNKKYLLIELRLLPGDEAHRIYKYMLYKNIGYNKDKNCDIYRCVLGVNHVNMIEILNFILRDPYKKLIHQMRRYHSHMFLTQEEVMSLHPEWFFS